ncbi:MAG: c-type cytochrome [Magnetococcales bacterium]|nr:c-type cytochrome [Magnetococcales bacterium]
MQLWAKPWLLLLLVVLALPLPAGWVVAEEQPDAMTRGRDLFRKNCIVCHPSDVGGGHRNGPNLWGVVGRKVASSPVYPYSDALREWGREKRWDMAQLNPFLANPAQVVPGVRMGFKGIADAEERTALLTFLSTLAGSGASQAGSQNDRIMPLDWGGLPEGNGRKEVFFTCQACHSLMIVKQQRLSRRVWDETLRWMVSEKKMPEPPRETREKILDYLAGHFGETAPRVGMPVLPPLLPPPPPPP